MTTWFTSDQHYGHTNIISFCKRPFESATEMNEAMIKNYQALVKPKDVVYILGDLAFCDPEPIVNRLPGQKHLVLGNHDQRRKNQLHRLPFNWIKESALVDVEGQSIFLCHHPWLSWPRGAWHLYGHLHGNPHPALKYPLPFALDVGVDAHHYAPISFEQVKQHFSEQPVHQGTHEQNGD